MDVVGYSCVLWVCLCGEFAIKLPSSFLNDHQVLTRCPISVENVPRRVSVNYCWTTLRAVRICVNEVKGYRKKHIRTQKYDEATARLESEIARIRHFRNSRMPTLTGS